MELFAKLDGITNKASEAKLPGEVKLTEFAFGSEAPVAGAVSTGTGAGKATISTFEVVTKTSSFSPALQRDLADGTVIPTVEIDVVHRSGKGDTVVASYGLQGVVLKSIQENGATETVLGAFLALKQTLGTGNDKVATGWNQIKNTASWNLVQNKAG